MIHLKEQFTINVQVEPPIVIGQDDISGRRQLIPIIGGSLKGENMEGQILSGGVDSQVIRPNGRCELSARYVVKLNNGASFYIENNGIRTVPKEYVNKVLAGEFIEPSLYYFRTVPKFEVYDERLSWMYDKIWVCEGKRLTDCVLITFYTVE